MKLFVPLIATATLAVCISASGIAFSQTTEESSSETTTTTPMAPASVTETTTVNSPVATSRTTTTTSDSVPQPSTVQQNDSKSTSYGPMGDKTETHDSSTTYSP